jgi:hypothetical protein
VTLTECVAVQSAAGSVPSSYELVGQKKGWKRYRSPRLAELVRDHAAAQEDREAALSTILRVPPPSSANPQVVPLTLPTLDCLAAGESPAAPSGQGLAPHNV